MKIYNHKYRPVVMSYLTNITSGYKSLLTLSSGYLTASLVPFLAAPVLGRIYTPNDYALLGVYSALSLVIGPVSTLKFEESILLEKQTAHAAQAARLSFCACALMTVSASFLSIACIMALGDAFGPGKLKYWFTMLPYSVACVGISLIAIASANRAGAYKAIATLQFSVASTTAVASIAFGLLGMGGSGLLLSVTLGQAILLILSFRMIKFYTPIISSNSYKRLYGYFRKKIRYLTFSTPTVIVASLGVQLPMLLFTYLDDLNFAGAFYRAQSLLMVVVGALIGPITLLYIRNARKEMQTSGSCRRLFIKTEILIFIPGLVFCFVFFLLSETAVRIYLGSAWSLTGILMGYLSVYYLFMICAAPVNKIFLFDGKQHIGLYISIISNICIAASCLTASYLTRSSEIVFIVFVVCCIIQNSVSILLSYANSSEKLIGSQST